MNIKNCQELNIDLCGVCVYNAYNTSNNVEIYSYCYINQFQNFILSNKLVIKYVLLRQVKNNSKNNYWLMHCLINYFPEYVSMFSAMKLLK